MGEFAKQVFAFGSLIAGLIAGWYMGSLVYYDQIAIATYYGVGGSLLYAVAVGFLAFVLVAGVLYKTVHPH